MVLKSEEKLSGTTSPKPRLYQRYQDDEILEEVHDKTKELNFEATASGYVETLDPVADLKFRLSMWGECEGQ